MVNAETVLFKIVKSEISPQFTSHIQIFQLCLYRLELYLKDFSIWKMSWKTPVLVNPTACKMTQKTPAPETHGVRFYVLTDHIVVIAIVCTHIVYATCGRRWKRSACIQRSGKQELTDSMGKQ